MREGQTMILRYDGVEDCRAQEEASTMVLGKPAKEGESPVSENERDMAVSRVPRDTWNLVGTSGDHPVRLNTTQ